MAIPYGRIIERMYNTSCEDVDLDLYDSDMYTGLRDGYGDMLATIEDSKHKKNLLILGFEFLMKKMRRKSAKISYLRDEIAELRGEIAGLRGELAELRVQNAELRGELAELRDNLGEIISRMRS
jgi:predicted nuclease with TOPRIM domain